MVSSEAAMPQDSVRQRVEGKPQCMALSAACAGGRLRELPETYILDAMPRKRPRNISPRSAKATSWRCDFVNAMTTTRKGSTLS